jgi:hypothetical protein
VVASAMTICALLLLLLMPLLGWLMARHRVLLPAAIDKDDRFRG